MAQYTIRKYRCFIVATLLASVCFSQIQEDKKLHFAAGNVIGAAGYVYSYNKHYDKKRAFINGVCSAFGAGVLKEIYDGENDGYVEHNDILATTIGGIRS